MQWTPSRTAPALFALLLLTASFSAQAQTPRERADAAFAASEWSEAATLYREILTADGDDPNVLYLLGTTQMRLGNHQAALAAVEQAMELGYPEIPARFAIAKVTAAMGNAETSFKNLERIASLGSSRQVILRLEADTEFDGMRSDPRFAAVLSALMPCNTAAYRQFDFWLGEWEVQNPQGQVVGQNTITALLDGCMLFEDWTGLGGSKGVSINYYDHRDGSWTQTYRDNTGNIATWPNLIGGLREEAMTLETAPGVSPMSRWVWTKVNDDKVRQMAEVSTDEGETWSIVWDSYYIRKQ